VPNARLWLAKATSADPENFKAHLEYANFLLKTGDRQKGIEELHKSLNLNPVQPDVSARLTELAPTGNQLPPPKP
jgi:predicted Zn-dependent protease